MDEARARFSPDVVSFGTATDIVFGIDALHDQQWSAVWPSIRGFTFDVHATVVLPSPDGLQAVAVVPWTSQGRDGDGWVDRPGRATVVLERAAVGEPWLGTHTHFSLVPVPRG
jgi:ketosteroid isomerase-like protein